MRLGWVSGIENSSQLSSVGKNLEGGSPGNMPHCIASGSGSHFSCFCINSICILHDAQRQLIYLIPLIVIHPQNYVSVSHTCLGRICWPHRCFTSVNWHPFSYTGFMSLVSVTHPRWRCSPIADEIDF